MDFMKSVDTWFLIVAVALLGGFFLWAAQYIFGGIKESIASLDSSVQRSAEKMERLIGELFNHRNNHENRIVALETRCDIQHGDDFHSTRLQPGRRSYDPAHFPQEQP
jgi:hypothetical protein